MNEKIKKTLMKSISQGNSAKFIRTLNDIDLVLDESYFDYELLKVALDKERGNIAKILIRKGSRVRNPNKTNLEETPLHLAMKLEDLSVISVILDKDASFYDKNLQGDTPLHAAFKERYYCAVDTVLDYISDCDLSFNPDNKDDIVHFHIACIRKHVHSVKLYLSLGFDVNSHLSIDSAEFSGLTPLHYLVSKKDYGELFQILLEHSDLSIANSEGLTALHCIYYNCDQKYEENDLYYSSNLYVIMTKVFKHGNNTIFNNAVDKSGVSHFHLCCSTGCLDSVKVFIDNGANVNCSISLNDSRDPGYTPLHFATKYSGIDVIELLLKNGADCNRADKNGVTPLHLATQILEGDDDEFKLINLLLDFEACPIAVDRLGNTPIHFTFPEILHYANEQVKIMDRLISKIPEKVNLTDKNGLSYFHIVCSRNYPDRVIDYLNSGVAIDSVSHSSMFPGYTALHFAVAFNQRDVVEVLLKRNAQVNISSAPYFNTPLHLACEFTRLKLYEVDCEYEKKCQADNKEENVDWIANRTSHLDIIKLLLLYGADIKAKNYLKYTPLFAAFYINDDVIPFWSEIFENAVINEVNTRLIQIINLLLSNKANIHGCEDVECESIFHVISKGEFLKISDELMEYLLNAGADINAVDKNGLTPLHFAAQWSKKELVEIFVKYKANVNIKCKKSQTPLELIISAYTLFKDMFRSGHGVRKSGPFCIKFLLENGSDVNIQNQEGRSLLHYAAISSSSFVTENLFHYGADINVEDSSGKTPVCSLLKKIQDGQVRQISRINVSCIIYIHIHKLLALGLYVNDKVQKFYNYFCQYYKTVASETNYNGTCKIFNKCINELNRMKIKKIDNYTSLYDVLLKKPHELSKHIKNRTLIKILEQDIDVIFPLYSYLLKLQYKRGLLRRDVLKEAKSSLIFVTSSNLPEECYDSILTYLTNEEIVNLKEAVAMKDSFKRKLSNDCSEKVESSTKLQKTSEI